MILSEIEIELDKIIEEQGMSYIKGQLFKNNFLRQCNLLKEQMIKDGKYTDFNYKQVCLFALYNLKTNMEGIKQV